MAGLRLEIFDSSIAPDGSAQPLVEMSALEEAKIAAFEQGYSAGWEDATDAQRDEQAKIRADLARNLQSLAFTFQDARSHVLQAIRPLILEMTEQLLPVVAREALAPIVLEALMPLAETMGDAPLVLVLNPSAKDRVEDLITKATGLPMVVDEEPSLAEGQVYIRFGPTETKVDLTQVTADITAAVRAYFNLTNQESSHG
jgi:flagellar biosynthesis/type III secretory pathway protein FliH